jgi:predicted GIY-YIG superfamily endonuclease
MDEQSLEKIYSEKRKPYIRALQEPAPSKDDIAAYTQWLEKRLECVTRLMTIEMSHKVFPQEDFGRQEFILEIPQVRTRFAVRSIKQKAGFVYLLQADNGTYKIGHTKNPDNRLATFKVKLPFEVQFLRLISSKDMYALEKRLHRRFAKKRLNRSEFFNLSEDDVNYICNIEGDE